MASEITTWVLLLLCMVLVRADDIDGYGQTSAMGKLMRAMVNQTKADTLELPANSTSIRENITDTFSCDNRTYGYYADVDNDCQLFHVCLPSQTPSGRNVTYKWSFICPSETVFNQEVLVCTRERDSIPCEDSPMYFDLNMEIGKESNDSREQLETNDKPVKNPQTEANNNNNYNSPAQNNNYNNYDNNYNTNNYDNNNNYNTAPENNYNKPAEKTKPKTQQRKQQMNKRKQNLVVQGLIKEVIAEEMKKNDDDSVEFGEKTVQIPDDETSGSSEVRIEDVDLNVENIPENNDDKENIEIEGDMENSRITAERSLKRGRKTGRGVFRFKADV